MFHRITRHNKSRWWGTATLPLWVCRMSVIYQWCVLCIHSDREIRASQARDIHLTLSSDIPPASPPPTRDKTWGTLLIVWYDIIQSTADRILYFILCSSCNRWQFHFICSCIRCMARRKQMYYVKWLLLPPVRKVQVIPVQEDQCRHMGVHLITVLDPVLKVAGGCALVSMRLLAWTPCDMGVNA